MNHQLEPKTMCRPESKEQAIEILKLAKERGLLSLNGYTDDVLEGTRKWPDSFYEFDEYISFSKLFAKVFAYGRQHYKLIPVAEFISRLKGEWVEPETEPDRLKEQVDNLQRQLNNLRQQLKDKGIITKY